MNKRKIYEYKQFRKNKIKYVVSFNNESDFNSN